MTLPETSTFMQHALALAAQSLLLTSPNPRVGCVITTADGQVLGRGATQRAGEAHAEIMALRDAAAHGHSVVGATAYVTLEPCSHQGRTGPCCDALATAGISKVVAAIGDPNPLVTGNGFERLRAAGIELDIGPGGAESRELNIGFFSRMLRQTPWVRMKLAALLDGKTALDNGLSQWITSPAARTDGHAWRARACAVLTGIGTVLADNPKLDVRLVDTPRQPALVVVDSRLETPLDAALFMPGRTLIIYAAVPNADKQAALAARGATVVLLPGPNNKVDLVAMLRDLARREINELHVEAGEKLNGSLIREGLVDEFVVYLAPKLIGQGRGMAHFGPLQDLAQAVSLEFKSSAMLGPDLRVVARVCGRDVF
ncbi:bifunctional diaminohydroxyphosphoribosylaminopyrimidine deaminase/5-amino-6-(5-phosphoribosylamino)uracil reductase RibD [Rhodoferax sp.]|uniref:bifunctional diaminohydroxyphosphoribosylaminopyrimidine deaminase/5-amino-6-(5-phosphoribosylamino)uracil reductase RibD n=1 Tax=Rhodoferax sp. TaxID=50421 RepID=UPI00262D0BCA|nr:bifunctional diaminohydroxyphosphoribosylaminopyrimidine deaminase/5-amino-6-(5-phosphoribosylamino)uracil reductase RibD [Rhodoferax sp.]MDD2920402.1 bifunctional diaminohydroxyphosphoribosylaminopyrimidine deaminase/5-amino-6-(5-phosphoribosylamino)uracil reductase RibD [Rhodoferax sp.]